MVECEGMVEREGDVMCRILVIDDDPDLRALLASMLQPAGHSVSLAADGSQGMNQFRADPADMVLTDIFMPVKEGLETIFELRRLCPELPIVAMSGRPVGSTMLCIARHLGAMATLEKPFSREELLAVVDKACN